MPGQQECSLEAERRTAVTVEATATAATAKPTSTKRTTTASHREQDIIEVDAGHTTALHHAVLVLSRVVPRSSLGIGEDGVRLDHELELLLVSSLGAKAMQIRD